MQYHDNFVRLHRVYEVSQQSCKNNLRLYLKLQQYYNIFNKIYFAGPGWHKSNFSKRYKFTHYGIFLDILQVTGGQMQLCIYVTRARGIWQGSGGDMRQGQRTCGRVLGTCGRGW